MKKNKLHKQWFTLIELLITISIMAMITLMSYAPFAHYQSKQRVVNSAKIISQVLNDSRNSAIYWMASSTWNLDIWVLLEENSWEIKIMNYPFWENNPPVDYFEDKYLSEIIPLEKWVEITSSGSLFLFKAITWSWIYKNLTIDTDNKTIISVWMKWTSNWPLTKKIEYYTKTYISDVK